MFNKIKDTKEYTLMEILNLGVLGKSHHTVSAAIMRDRMEGNILKAKVEGKARRTRYSILGKNLRRYLSCK